MLTPIRSILVSLAVLDLALTTPSGPSARAAPDASCLDPGTLWVNNYSDTSDPGTLRWAIDQANMHLGPDRICFALTPAKQVIRLQSALPAITDHDLSIDASPNWQGTWPGGYPGIVLDGWQMPCCSAGLAVMGARNFTVKGLEIWGGWVPGLSSGLSSGIALFAAPGAVIGSLSPGGRLLIRGIRGVAISIDSSDDNQVLGVWIGTDDGGNQRVPNSGDGIHINEGHRNHIGRGDGYLYNVVGSSQIGVLIFGSDAISNTVEGNTIGPLTANGTITNTLDGIDIRGGASLNAIGGSVKRAGSGAYLFTPTTGNTINGSGNDGVHLVGTTTLTNGVMLSTIDSSGQFGIHIDGASNSDADFNTITRSGRDGLRLENGASGNLIQVNSVGTNPSGQTGLGNWQHGIGLYSGAQGNVLIGNTVVASGWSGIVMVNVETSNNTLLSNRVGVGPQGQALGNAFYGLAAVDGSFNRVFGNEIAYNGKPNGKSGTYFSGATAVGNSALYNSIHDNAGGGIALDSGANDNLAAPVVTSAVCPTVRGTGAPPNGQVQLFSDSADEGAVYEGQTYADAAGNWSLATKWTGPHLTATASQTLTSRSGWLGSDTSPFSAFVAAGTCRPLFVPLIKR